MASREGQEVIAAKMEAEEDARVPKSKRKKKKRVRDSSGDKFSTAAVEVPTRLVQSHEDGGGANVAAKAMEERMHSGEPFDEYGLASAEGVSGDEGPSHAPSQAIEKLEDVDSAYVALKIKKKHKKRISGDGEANTLAFEPRSQSNGQTLQSQENDMDADIRPTVFTPKKDREDKKRKRHSTADHDGRSEPSSIKKKLRKDDSAQASPNPVTHSLENIVSSPNARDYGKRGHLSLNGPNSPMGAMRTITPDRKAKEKLLLQTILKGRQNHVQQLSEPNGKSAATAEINLRGSSIGYSPDTNATKGPKAETRRRSESERNDLLAISSPPTTSTGFTRDFPPYSDSNEACLPNKMK